jgi:hypothetical protein
VLTDLSRLFFPCGFHSATCLAILQSSLRMKWPHLLNCCSVSFSPIFVMIVFVPNPFVSLIFYVCVPVPLTVFQLRVSIFNFSY